MPQPAQVAFKEGPQVGDAVFQHGDPVDAHAKGKALPLAGVDPRRSQNLGVDHAAAQNLQPAVALAHLQHAPRPGTADIDLGRGFGKRKVAGAEPQFHLVDLEIGAAEFLQHPFQVGHADIAVNRQPLDLMEHRRVGLVHVHPVNAARRDDADGRALRLHGADLHGAGVGAQHMGRARVTFGPGHEERVMFLPRRMFGRNVQRIEIEPVAFDLRPFGDGKAHVGENDGDFLGHLTDRVDRALTARTARQGDIQPFGAQPLVQRRIGQPELPRTQGRVDFILQQVQRHPRRLPRLGRHLAQFAHLQADLALFAQGGDAQILQRRLVGGPGDAGQVIGLQLVKRVHQNLRQMPDGASDRAA